MAKSKQVKEATQAVFSRLPITIFRKVKSEAELQKRSVGSQIAIILQERYANAGE